MDRSLVAKYNRTAPRYTSYPPANHFTADFSGKEYLRGIEDSNHWEPQNISLYFHIPFCTKKCHYCGCNAIGMRKADTVQRYVDAVIKELELVASHIDKKRLVSQVHFGGGTPNALDSGQLASIMNAVALHFKYTPHAERAIECNPAYLDEEYVNVLRNMGFNRFSLGIQDFNSNVLDAVNRDASKLPVAQLMQLIKQRVPGATINLDFIYGLPYQQPESFLNTIEQAISLRPDRLVTFSYAHMPSIFKGQRALEKFGLPDADNKWQMFQGAYEKLLHAGYLPIGLDHYALQEDELSKALVNYKLHRNFQGYCTRETTGQVYAFGVSGISQLKAMYAQNTKSLEGYIKSVEQGELPIEKGYKLSQNEIIIRECITEFMCNKKLVFSDIADRLNLTTQDIKQALILDNKLLDEFASDKIINYSDQELELGPQGLLFIRNVAASLDPLMQNSEKQYSTTV